MIEGALILLAGILVGRFAPSRRRAPKPRPEPKPICECGHGFHDHDPASSACHGRAELKRYSIAEERKVFDKYGPCTCRRYVGPEPLPTYVATEIAS